MRPEEREEKRFVKKVREYDKNIRCFKFEVHGTKGAPDRMILFPGGYTMFIEFKRPGGGTVSPHQVTFIKMLTDLGFEAYIIDNWREALEKVECRMKSICTATEYMELDTGLSTQLEMSFIYSQMEADIRKKSKKEKQGVA